LSCFRPLLAYQDRSGGQPRLGTAGAATGEKLELPCGRCVGCRMDRARAWSIRISHEAQLFDSNLFVTLDYDPEHLPGSLSLEYPDFQGFMKRLRRRLPGEVACPDGRRPIRFFVAGEYGSQFQRPHWHSILFNCRLPDQVAFENGTYRSSLMEDLWGKGNVVIGAVTAQSAAYVAGYTLEKKFGAAAAEHYEDVVEVATGELSSRRPEFVVMSRRPGIGAWWFDRFRGDVFPADRAVMGTREYRVPRYYTEKLRAVDPLAAEEVAFERYLVARAVDPHESSEERRAVREEYAERRLDSFGGRKH